jgi:ATP-dependent DNA ligase
VESGIEGGKIRDTVPTIVTKGKNISRKNATNPFTQALRDALSLYTKQVDKATREGQGSGKRYPPMLSEIYGDFSSGINFNEGVYVQRKYDGVRTVAMYDPEVFKDNLGNMVGSVVFYSRTRKTYNGFDYIRQELIHGLRELHAQGIHLYIDGEMYKHGMKLQDISGYARREDKPTDVRIDYMVYDVFIPEKPDLKYSERKEILDKFFADYGPFRHVYNVETFMANSNDDVQKYFKNFLSEGYEGAMVRPDLPYRYSDGGYHSRNLLKLKQTLDAEFTIVGYTVGEKGKSADAILFICENNSGIRFNVTPAMEIEERLELAKKMADEVQPGITYFDANYKGKKLIVYFDDWSRDGVPQRARTKGEVRTWE